MKRTSVKRAQADPAGRDIWAWVGLALVLVFLAVVRIRLLGVPLERDEGEYAYAGQLMLHGVPPYKLAYNMKLPGTYAAYALVMALFGQTVQAVHVGLLLVNAGAVSLVFLIARKLFDNWAAVTAAVAYAALSLSPRILGTSAHATHFVVVCALGGILLLLKGLESGRRRDLFWGGLLLGLAFLMKQAGVMFALFGVFFWLVTRLRENPRRAGLPAEGALLAGGAVIPFALTCLILAASGVFARFWFWTFQYAREYASQLTLQQGWMEIAHTLGEMFVDAAGIWAVAGLGLLALVWLPRARKHWVFLVGLLVVSFAAVCPGLYFRQHYFVVMLPAIALLAGVAVIWFREILAKSGAGRAVQAIPFVLFLLTPAYLVNADRERLFELTPDEVSRATYAANPFPEAVKIGEYIREHTKPGDRIAVVGSEPEIYFYSQRVSATGYIYTYPLMERQKYALDMQREMAREIERARPEYMVFVNIDLSWLPMQGSDKWILSWADSYSARHYTVVGLVNIMALDYTSYAWDAEAQGRNPESPYYLVILKRKS